MDKQTCPNCNSANIQYAPDGDLECQTCGTIFWEDDTMDCGCASGSCYCDDEGDMDPVEADADVLRMAGWGTDEDYGYFGGEEY